MPSLCLNAAEQAALQGLPHLSRLIYLSALRPYMDYGTGIVGIRRGVSWQSISEALYVEPHQGIKAYQPSEKELRRALVWLQKVGLLSANQDGKKRLIFECLLASRDNCARKKVGRLLEAKEGSSVDAGNTTIHAAFTAYEDTKVARSKTPKVGTPPAFKALNYLSTSAAHREEMAGRCALPAKADAAPPVDPTLVKFRMTLDWQPDKSSLEALASHLGVSLDAFTPALLADWRVYWHVKKHEREQTQQQWELQLIERLKHLAQEAAEQAQRAEARAESKRAKTPTPDTAAQSENTETPAAQPRAARPKSSGKVVPLRAGAAPSYQGTPKMETLTLAPLEEPALSPQSDEMMSLFWREMCELYGYKFSSQFGEQPSRAWVHALRDLNDEQILSGLQHLIDRTVANPDASKPIFPPSALEFLALCLQVPGLPDEKRAWFQAINADYSHEAVEYAARLTGFAALKSAKSGLLDASNMRALRDRFEISFAQVKERLQRGEPLQGRAAAEREREQKRQEAYSEYGRLKKIIDHGERQAAGNTLRAQALQARPALQALCEQFGFEPLPNDAPAVAASGNVQSINDKRRA